MPENNKISSSIRNPGDFSHNINGGQSYDTANPSRVQPKSNYQHSKRHVISMLIFLDQLSKPEDPDAWKYRPFSKFGNYSTTSAMILPSRMMSELIHEEEANLKHRFQRLRDEIHNQISIYCHYSMQARKYNYKNDFSKVVSLDNGRNTHSEKIDKLKEESIAIVMELARRENFQVIDLHGLHLAEAEEAVLMIVKELRERHRRKMTVKSQRTSAGEGESLEIITGKGRHTVGGMQNAVLLPKIKSYLESLGYQVKQNSGSLSVKIK